MKQFESRDDARSYDIGKTNGQAEEHSAGFERGPGGHVEDS